MTIREQGLQLIRESQHLTFLTGAGVSVPSGIPDYRSLGGVYAELEEPEYLLSHRCLVEEPAKFYRFVKQLYHPTARPNSIHQKMSQLGQTKRVKVVTQNIDQLHQKAGSDVINFHGNLYDCYCLSCHQRVSVTDYLNSDQHQECQGQIRPNVTLYEEGLDGQVIDLAIEAVSQADVVVLVGTSFKVYPFSELLRYRKEHCSVIIVNNESLYVDAGELMITEDATLFFEEV